MVQWIWTNWRTCRRLPTVASHCRSSRGRVCRRRHRGRRVHRCRHSLRGATLWVVACCGSGPRHAKASCLVAGRGEAADSKLGREGLSDTHAHSIRRGSIHERLHFACAFRVAISSIQRWHFASLFGFPGRKSAWEIHLTFLISAFEHGGNPLYSQQLLSLFSAHL